MKKLLLALGILALICSPAMAGRNANGAMVVHTDNSVVYTPTDNYCTQYPVPQTCEELNANATGGIDAEQVIWLCAAFRPEASPGVTTVQFGIDHNLPANQGYFTSYGSCGPQPLELPDEGWPETGFGNLVAYGAPVYDHVFKFYWFAVFVDGPANYFGTRTYPSTNEAKFVDDSNPPIEDLCTHFGTVRWDGTGANDCPGIVVIEGACCFPDGSCQVLPRADCDAQGGVYQGDDTVCEQVNCPAPEACCFADGSCQMLMADECAQMGGTAQGAGTTCDTVTCPAPEACCFEDGSCQMLMADECTQMGGTPQGAGTTCDTVECPVTPTGACCDAFGGCTVTTEANCDGTYMGDGTDCDTVECVVATQSTTWGQIKANYR